MSFGKANQQTRRHRPKASEDVEEIDEEAALEKRERRLNSPVLTTAITLVGSVMMLGIVVLGAPYTYGAKGVSYTESHILDAAALRGASQEEKDDASPKIYADFTGIVIPLADSPTQAMKTVAQTCRQGPASNFEGVLPGSLHRTYRKATRYLACALGTEIQRLCDGGERKLLARQLTDYLAKRQYVIGYDLYWDTAIAERDRIREYQRTEGRRLSKQLVRPEQPLSREMDPAILHRLEWLVRNGYLSAADFGFMGLYVPSEFGDVLRLGADRYPVCPTGS